MLPPHWNFEARRHLLAKPRRKSTFRFSAGPFPGVLKDTWRVIWQITTLVVPHLSVPPQPVHGSPLPAEPLDCATWAQCPVDDREVLQTWLTGHWMTRGGALRDLVSPSPLEGCSLTLAPLRSGEAVIEQ